MTLRARLGIAAGVAVAIAVIAVAVSAYEGTRSDLTGPDRQSLRGITANTGPGRGPGPDGLRWTARVGIPSSQPGVRRRSASATATGASA